MKSKAQKQEELNEARKLLEKSSALVFTDFTKITAESIRKFRRELKGANADFLVIKKRLLGILFKEEGIDIDLKQFKISVGTIFSRGDIEKIAGPAFTFFSKLEVPEGGAKDMWVKHLLGRLRSREEGTARRHPAGLHRQTAAARNGAGPAPGHSFRPDPFVPVRVGSKGKANSVKVN